MTRRQLLSVGLSERSIMRRVQSGRLFREHAGVYAVGKPAVTPVERAAAAVLACGPGAALSHGSAMVLWGFWKRWPTRVEITVPGCRRPSGIHVHRSASLTSEDVVVHLGIPVTSPSRTIHDIAPRLSDRRLARTIDDAIHSGFLTASALAQQVHDNPRRAGTARIQALLGTSDGPSRSDWERAFPAFCRRHHLPPPQMNVTVCGYEVDALFADEKLIVELDGWAFHASRASFERDRDRDADTLRAGYATMRITWQRMTSAPDNEGKRLAAILAARRSV